MANHNPNPSDWPKPRKSPEGLAVIIATHDSCHDFHLSREITVLEIDNTIHYHCKSTILGYELLFKLTIGVSY